MKKIYSVTAILASLFLILVLPISAQEVQPLRVRQPVREANTLKPMMASKSGMKRLEASCNGIEEKIATTINRYNTNGQRHKTQYQQMRTKLQTVITALEAKKVDVTKLKSDLKTLDAKILDFNEDLDAVIVQLQTAQQFPCGESEGRFLSEMAKARDLMNIVRQDVSDIRSLYTNTIKSDVRTVRSQVVQQRATPKPMSTPTP